jgi:hypothetical protein
MQQFIDRAICQVEHRSFPSKPARSQRACRCSCRILRYPSIVTSYAEPSAKTSRLLLVVLSLVVDDVEEAELVDTLGSGDDAEPVTELLLLEELLGAAHR